MERRLFSGNILAILSFPDTMRLLLIILLFLPFVSFAQDDGEEKKNDMFTISTPVTIDLGEKKEEVEPKKKKKKPKKNVYYGLKTKKGFARKGVGNKITLELFHYLKTPVKPDPYVRDIYYYDFDRKQIRKTRNYKPENGVLLHGPYTKKINELVVEEGIFYRGTKHGRWTRYDKNEILLDKEKYYKGWPKESLVSFYDKERTKIKEIIPVEYGKKEGYYFYFFANGTIAVSGEYEFDNKVGKWSLFYPNRRGRKEREIQYRKDPFDDDFSPYILREWNSKGKQIYDYTKDKKIPQ